jgi:membrane protein implicated in regulation of membrane protease activity
MRAFALQAGVDLLGPETLPFILVAAGLVLAILETTAPGAHFIVLGAALFFAGAVGLVATSVGLSILAGPAALGAMVVAFGAATLWAYRNIELYPSEGGRTSDSAALDGATGRVTERVTPAGGEVRLDEGGFDPHYTARSVDGEIAVGTEVIVVDPGGGNVLTVESFESTDSIDRALAEGRDRTTEPDPDRTTPETTPETETETDAGG